MQPIFMLYEQFRSEMWKLLGKKRTYLGFFIFLIAQNIILLIFQLPRPQEFMRHLLAANGYNLEPFRSSLTFATGMAFPFAHLLVPLYAALVGGDLVAKESEDGTLRMILSRPVSRLRLLLLKWFAGIAFAILLVLSLGAFGLGFASIWFPWRGLFVFAPQEIFSVFDAATGFQRYLLAHLLMVASAVTTVSIAFMFSCFRMKPAAATVLALTVLFLSSIIQEMPYFSDVKHCFLTYHLNLWHAGFAERIPWWRIGSSISILAGVNVTCLIIGCAAFQVRDIKS